MNQRDYSEILTALGEDRQKYFRAVSPPIIQTSNFAFETSSEMRDHRIREFEEHVYTRGNNPTVNILRKKLAALEKTDDALVFSSGSAAVSAAVLSQLQAGDHIISVDKPYHWTQKLMNIILDKYGVETTFIDGTKNENFEAALRPNTKLVYLESPNSFTFELQDLEWVGKFAKEHGLTTIIDNSYSSPLYQNPVDYGIDIIIHSASKYLGGHSDIVAGVLCSSKEHVEKIFASEFMTLGSKLGPFDSWLMIRGLRTLEIRLERNSQTAAKVVNWLAQRPEIEKVLYPFHESHPQHDLARKQMRGSGGLFTLGLKIDSVSQAEKFCDSLNRFLIGVSWGGHESLVFPACAGLEEPKITDPNVNLVRVFCGLESPDYLIEDLEQALENMNK